MVCNMKIEYWGRVADQIDFIAAHLEDMDHEYVNKKTNCAKSQN